MRWMPITPNKDGGFARPFPVEIELERRLTEDFCARRRIGDGADQPIDGGAMGEFALMADEGAVACPYQPLGTGDTQQLPGVNGLRPEPDSFTQVRPLSIERRSARDPSPLTPDLGLGRPR